MRTDGRMDGQNSDLDILNINNDYSLLMIQTIAFVLLESSRLRALPREILPTINLAHAPPGLRQGSGVDPKVILFVRFVDWAKKIL